MISKFALAAKNGDDIVIFGDGEQSRDFIHVRDIARANYLAAMDNKSKILNVASGREITINELAKSFQKLATKEIEIIYKDAAIGDIRYSRADVSKIKKSYNFTAEKSVTDTIKELL